MLLSLSVLAACGYEAALSTAVSEVKTGDAVTVSVNLSGGAGASFAAVELDISYDSANLRFDSIEPQPRSVTADGGTIRIVDCGGDKSLGTGAYKLHFTAINKGNAEVELTSACLGTKQTAATEDLETAAITTARCTVAIDPTPAPSPTPTPKPTPQPAPQDKTDGSASTKTGDTALPLLWLTLCIVCGVAVIVITKKKKEKTPD